MNNASNAYLNHLATIKATGNQVRARGLYFKEVIGLQYSINMAQPVPLVPERNLGMRFAAAEPYWILSGGNKLQDITDYGKMSPYSDDGYTMSGAYGPKIIDQLGYVCKTLADDRGSRQAVLNIWRERPGPSKDIPCTLSLQFLVRDGFMDCVATMRSSDAYMGLPYDSILFSLTSAYIISILKHYYNVEGIILGTLHLNCGSAHFYDRDEGKIDQIIRTWDFISDDFVIVDLNDRIDDGLHPDELLDSLRLAKDSEDGIMNIILLDHDE